MKRYWVFKGFKFAAFAVAAVAVAAYLVMSLWNFVLPAVTGLRAISFAQALGLLVLSRLLFGGWRGRGGWHWRRRLRERWEQMTPEQREQMRQTLRSHSGRCGFSESHAGQ
jgi:hypothetical protein